MRRSLQGWSQALGGAVLPLLWAVGSASISVVSPAPVDTTEPTFHPGTDLVVLAETTSNLRSTTTVALLDAMPGPHITFTHWSVCPCPSNQVITPGRAGRGVAIRGVQPQSSGQVGADWESAGTARITPRGAKEAFQFWFRLLPAGTQGPGNGGIKWFMAWNYAANDRWQVGAAYSDGVYPPPLFGWQGYGGTYGYLNRGKQPVGPRWADINDGHWHRWTILWKPNTTWNYPNASARDGILRVWIDGKKIIDISQAAVNVTPPRGTTTWCVQQDVDALPATAVDFIRFPGTQVGLNQPTWSVDYDDFLWWVVLH